MNKANKIIAVVFGSEADTMKGWGHYTLLLGDCRQRQSGYRHDDETKKKLKILQKRTDTKLADAKREYQGKVVTLNDQLKDAKKSPNRQRSQKK